MKKSASLQPTLPDNLKDYKLEQVINTWLEPYWWELQKLEPYPADKQEKMLDELERIIGFRLDKQQKSE